MITYGRRINLHITAPLFSAIKLVAARENTDPAPWIIALVTKTVRQEVDLNAAFQARINTMTKTNSVVTFVSERCDLDPTASIECRKLFAAFKSWGLPQFITSPASITQFGRALRDNLPLLRTRQRSVGTYLSRFYEGIKLREPQP